jgi:xanthine dehydrogenase accessory factor
LSAFAGPPPRRELVLVKGAGDLASGIALRLFRARFRVVMTETAAPSAVRRTVAFCRAVSEGRARVEDADALLAGSASEALDIAERGLIAVLVDPLGASLPALAPAVLADAIIAKRNTGTAINDAPLVIAVGPGFTAGIDCHCVIETQRGHNLGRVLTADSVPPRAAPNTGVPGDIGGFTVERLLRSPADGVFEPRAAIGQRVRKGEVVAEAGGVPMRAAIDGVLRGLLPHGFRVKRGQKSGDIDPRCEPLHCFTVSDKALAIGGGVLEAVLRFT